MGEELRLLWKVYLAELLRGVGAFIVPFMVLFLQAKSLSFAQIGILLGTVSLTNFFLEIPTGIVADKYGRKFSAILGFIISYLSFFLMIFTDSFPILLFLFFSSGVGFTFTSGAYDAWIYEYLKSNKKERYMHNFYSQKLSFSYLGMVLAGLIGGYLVGFLDLYWLLVFDTILGIPFLYFLLQVPDPPILKERGSISVRKFIEATKQGFSVIRNNRNLMLILVAQFSFTFAVGAKEMLSQPAYVNLGMPLSYIGYIAAISGYVLFVVPTMLLRFSTRHPKRFIILFAVFEFLLMGSILFVTNYILFAALIVLSILSGAIIGPIYESIFQHSSKTEVRATVRSILEMSISVAYFIVFITFGLLADSFGPQVVLAVSSLFIIPAIVCYFLLRL